MTLRRVVAPTEWPISLAEAKAHLRVDHDEDDALIGALIAAAFAHAEMTTGRAFAMQTWERIIDAFPANEISIGMGPVQSVVSVTYFDEDGEAQVLPADAYEADLASEAGWIAPSDGWPATLSGFNSVAVRFVVGGDTPLDVRHAVLMLIALWYDTRATATAETMTAVPLASEALLSLHRRYYV